MRSKPAQSPGRFSTPGPGDPPHYRVRHDRYGAVSLRHNSRLHHIGLSARLADTPITMLIDDLHIHVVYRHTGEPIRDLTLDSTTNPADYAPAPPATGVQAGRQPPEGHWRSHRRGRCDHQ